MNDRVLAVVKLSGIKRELEVTRPKIDALQLDYPELVKLILNCYCDHHVWNLDITRNLFEQIDPAGRVEMEAVETLADCAMEICGVLDTTNVEFKRVLENAGHGRVYTFLKEAVVLEVLPRASTLQ